MRTRLPLLLILVSAAGLAPLAQSKQTLLMTRLGPSQMTLYIANGDGSGERPLLADCRITRNIMSTCREGCAGVSHFSGRPGSQLLRSIACRHVDFTLKGQNRACVRAVKQDAFVTEHR